MREELFLSEFLFIFVGIPGLCHDLYVLHKPGMVYLK